jgi:hypothetical protein
MKQTAVEWLVETITKKHDKDFSTFYGAEIEQAKEMEYHQITEAFINGEVARDRIDSIEYYQETYGK